MGIEGDIERCTFQYRYPEVGAGRKAAGVHPENGNVVDQYPFGCLGKGSGLQFLFQKVGLIDPVLREVVHAVIDLVAVGFVFPAVKKDKAGVPQGKSTVGTASHSPEVIPQV